MLAHIDPGFGVCSAATSLYCQTMAMTPKAKDPLKSVENQLVTNGLSPSAGQIAGELLAKPRPIDVTRCDINGGMDAVTTTKTMGLTIRTEPFADQYTVHGEIGRGQFAVVKRCRRRVPPSDVPAAADVGAAPEFAAKFIRKRRRGRDCRAEIEREVHMLTIALDHPRLVDVVEVFETQNELVIVTEFAAGGELFKQVVLEEAFRERDVVRLMRQILDGLSFLHERNIVHLDIKPQNILLTQATPIGDIKLCDFGFARLVNSGEDILDIVGTPDYVAPEVLSYEPIRTACDMWSVGVLAYVMLTGCSPFGGDTKQETFLNIAEVNLDFPAELFDDVSPHAVDFISKLLVRDPLERMTVHDSLAHHWFFCELPPTSADLKLTSNDLAPTDLVPTSADLTPTSTDLTPTSVEFKLTSVEFKLTSVDLRPTSVDLRPTSVDLRLTTSADLRLTTCADLRPTLSATTTPVGSPLGVRRSLTAVVEVEPSKKSRCDDDSGSAPHGGAACSPPPARPRCADEENGGAPRVALADPQLAY